MNDPAAAPLTLKELAAFESDRQLRNLRYSPCEQFLIGGTYDGDIRRWNVAGEEPAPLPPLKGHRAWVEAVRFTADAMYSADSWGMLRRWSLDSIASAAADAAPQWQQETAHDGWIRALAVSADGKRLATAGIDRVARVWNAADGELVGEFQGHEHELFAVAIDDAGEQIVAGDLMGNLRAWNVASGECIREKRLEQMHYYGRDQDVAGLYHLAFHNQGATLLCAGAQPTKIQNVFGVPLLLELDADTWEVTAEHRLGVEKDGFIFDFAWHEAGYFMYIASGAPGAGRLVIQKLGDEKPLYDNTKLTNPHCLAYAPGRRQLAVTATNRNSQGNGAVTDKEGNYLGNTSPMQLFELVAAAAE